MSDEDFLNADLTSFDTSEDEGDEQETASSDSSDDNKEEEEETNTSSTSEDKEESSGEESDEEDEYSESDEEDDDTDDDSDKSEEDKTDKEKDTEQTDSTDGELTSEQYADVGRQVMGEFKANGTTMKMKSAEDIIQLMQMGANYHKKMSALKPSLKSLKLLENNDLLDTEKLNYLIDLSQKKPDAIKQLLKESKLDPMELDLEEETNYKPDQRTVSDTEMVLDEVLDSISGSPSYDRTLTVLGDEWDQTSRNVVAQNPEVIRTINAHMENGIFDQVAQTVAYERSLGKLVGLSDFQAYQQVGEYMHKNNMFKSATKSPPADKQEERQKQPSQQNTDSQRNSEERKSRKKAASSSRQKPATNKGSDNYNPLAMSDEEFVKINNLNL